MTARTGSYLVGLIATVLFVAGTVGFLCSLAWNVAKARGWVA